MSKKEKNNNQEAVNENIIEEPLTDTPIEEQEESTEQANPPEAEQKQEKSDWQDKYIRMLAEFDNYKKRTQREREQLYKDATADAVTGFLPIIDTLERAVSVEVESDEAQGLLDGINAIKKQFEDILSQIGVEAIEATGNEFNPNLHNAVMHIDDDSVGENIIVEEFAKGYMYKDKVIRHSMVKVAN